jgi:myo-inositol catabolism protein IolC
VIPDREPMSAPNESWLPSPDEPLFVLAIDHRGSVAMDLFGITGAPSRADLSRMRQAKALIYEGLRHVAGSIPFGREGVLIDEYLGEDVIRSAQSDGVVVLMPIEGSGSGAFELVYGDQLAEHVDAFDPDFFTALVRYNPDDAESVRRTEIGRLAAVSEWAGRTKRRWITELLVTPMPEQLATHHGRGDFDRTARHALTAQVIAQLQDGGVHPTIWELEGFDAASGADEALAAAAADGRYPAACMVVGRDAPIDLVEHWLAVAADRQFVGFVVDRTVWEEPLRQFLAGALSSEGVIHAVAATYTALVHSFIRGSQRLTTPPG